MNKRISIIIPCYNVENYIDRCFECLENQTIGMDAMEIIFVNDASTDNTLDKLSEFEQRYPESVILINFEINHRQAAARNIAIEYASAPYIGYMDSDDSAEPDMYERMVSAIEEYDCDFVECRYNCIEDNTVSVTKPFSPPGYLDLTEPHTYKNFISSRVALVTVWDKVYKKSFLTDNDIYCPEQVLCEDIFFSFLVFTYAKSTYCMNDVFYHYYINPKSTLQTKKINYQDDVMNVTLDYLRVCTERNLINDRKEAIEWLFLEKYYVYMLWEIFHKFPELSYKSYCMMRETILDLVPDYKTNSYRLISGNEFDDIMLKLLDHELSEIQLMSLADNMIKKFNI